MRNRKKLEVSDSLNVNSLKHLALQIAIPQEELIHIADNIEKYFLCENRSIKKKDGTTKTRAIYHPSVRLKEILRAIDRYLLKKIKLPDSMHGARKNHSNVTNANEHVNKKHVFNTDIENCFPSIKPYNVFQLFKRLQCSTDVAKCLSRLCTADNHLPQGYNTSPSIANLVLSTPVKRIDGLCKRPGLKPTAFVDDISISGNKNPSEFRGTLEKIINECGFNIKAQKTKCFPNSSQQKVTGIVVNKKPNIDSYKELRSLLFICRKFGPAQLLHRGIENGKGETIDNNKRLKKYLSGRLSYLQSVNPQRAEKLRSTFDSINWT